MNISYYTYAITIYDLNLELHQPLFNPYPQLISFFLKVPLYTKNILN